MSKTFTNFDPGTNIASGITPAGGSFPLVESHDILVENPATFKGEGKRLDAKLTELDEAISAITDGDSGGLNDKIDKTSITTAAPATTNTDTQVPSTKSVATALATKPTGTLTTTVAATADAVDTKIPTEKAVRDAIDSKTITVDSALNTTSTNAIQNKVVKEALDLKQNNLTFDSTPTASSNNPVTSGGIKTALDTKQDNLTFDSTPTASSNNPVTSGGVKNALDTKQDNLTFDSSPTDSSSNPVTSGGVKAALDLKQDNLTFDSTPTASSSNPVTSGGVKSALDTKQDNLTFDSTPTANSSNPVTSGGVKSALDLKQDTLTFDAVPVTDSVNPVTSVGIRNAITAASNANLGAMQAQYDEFAAEAQDILDAAATLSNGMVACANIAAETTPGDTRLLIYTGTTDATYTNGHWYYNSAAASAAPVWTDGGAVGTAPTVDTTLKVAGAAAESKSVGDTIDNIVTVSDSTPSNTNNKIWIKDTTATEVQVPTYDEFTELSNDITDILNDYNSFNIISLMKKLNQTVANVAFSWNGNNITVTGTASSSGWYVLFDNNSGMPYGIIPGHSYIIENSLKPINFNISAYDVNGNLSTLYNRDSTTNILTIPINAVGIRMRLYVYSGTSYNISARVGILTELSNSMLKDIINGSTTVSSNINISSSNQTDYPDVNNFPNRTIINVTSSANIENKPFNSCTIITTGFSKTDTAPYGGSKQIAIDNNVTGLAIRSHNGTSWGDWLYSKDFSNDSIQSIIDKNATKSSNINVSSTNQSQYPDVNDFQNRTIINVLGSANIENKPFNSCTIITTGFSKTDTAPYGGSKQIAIDAYGVSTAIRSHNGNTWLPWSKRESVFYADPDNYIEVIKHAVDGGNSIIYLESGNYNLFDETHNEEYWKTKRPATRYCGINLSNNVKIIGIGDVRLDSNYSGDDEDIKENFSVFNIAGTCELRNISVFASNICYIVHDDGPIVTSKTSTCIISGCKLIHTGSNHTFTTGAPMCIGAGESDNTYREYLNNVFSSVYDRAVNIHTKTNGFGRYIISGNYFISGTLGFTTFGDGSGIIEGVVNNNNLPSNIVNRSNGEAAPYIFNNEIRQ